LDLDYPDVYPKNIQPEAWKVWRLIDLVVGDEMSGKI
jgi:hypothetical protein